MEYVATVVKYDKEGICGVATGTFEQVFEKLDIENMTNDMYFKLYRFNVITYDYIEEEHFGCYCKKRGGLKINEGIYCNAYYNNQIKRYLKDEEWRKYESFLLLVRFYIFFKEATQLPSEEKKKRFDIWIKNYFRDWNEVYDLNKYRSISGIYALILDDYAKCYIGQARNIKNRILEHWRKDSFVTQGIDLFRAKDTTRIYAIPLEEKTLDANEFLCVQKIPMEFRLNILQGGSVEFHFSSNTSIFFHDDSDEDRKAWLIQQENKEKKLFDFFQRKLS